MGGCNVNAGAELQGLQCEVGQSRGGSVMGRGTENTAVGRGCYKGGHCGA